MASGNVRLMCAAEEVYFGKAKDVVGDLRSESARLFVQSLTVLTQLYRYRTALGDK